MLETNAVTVTRKVNMTGQVGDKTQQIMIIDFLKLGDKFSIIANVTLRGWLLMVLTSREDFIIDCAT